MFRKYKFLLLILAFGFNLWCELKIGVVNVQAAVEQQHEPQKYLKEFESEEQKLLKDKEQAHMSLEAEMMKLQKEKSKMTEKAWGDKEEAFRKRFSLEQEKFSKADMAFNQKKQSYQLELENKEKLLIESIARKKGFSMVINMAAVPYISEDMKKSADITPELVAEFNKAFPVKPKAEDKKAAPAKK